MKEIRDGWNLVYKIPEEKDDEMIYFLFSFDGCPLFYANFETSIIQLCAQTKILFCFESPDKFLVKDAKEEQNKKFEERKKKTISGWILKDFAAFFY